MKKCPPGVICVENVTLFLLFIIICIVGFFVYTNLKENNDQNKNVSEKRVIDKNVNNIIFEQKQEPRWLNGLSIPYYNQEVLLNPYSTPYRDERYVVPINISTSVGAVDTNYRQIGIMTPLNGTSKDNILALMGRPLFTNRDKWQYYTISNQHNNIKLPLSFKGKSALNDYGVDQIFSGDTVYVEGYNDAFKVTVYENDTIKYLPVI